MESDFIVCIPELTMASKKKNHRPHRTVKKKLHHFNIDPVTLMIRAVDEVFGVFFGNVLIRLPSGQPVKHQKETFLRHLCDELAGFGEIKLDDQHRLSMNNICSYALLDFQKLIEQDSAFCCLAYLERCIATDPMLHSCAGPEVVDQYARWQPVLRYLNDHNMQLPSLPQIPIELTKDSNLEEMLSPIGDGESAEKFCRDMAELILQAEPRQLAVTLFLHQGHNALLFPFILSLGLCSAQEYANGIMACHCCTTSFGVEAREHAQMTRLYKEDATVCQNFLDMSRPIHFQILEKCGDGLYGQVYKAYDNRLMRHVAIKAITNEFPNAPSSIEHARAIAKLGQHGNIVTVYAVERVDIPGMGTDLDAIVMEFFQSRRLGDILTQKSVPVTGAKQICSSIVRGLMYMHAANMPHRDLHFGNVLVADDFTTKIIDINPTTSKSPLLMNTKEIENAKIADVQQCRQSLLAIIAMVEGLDPSIIAQLISANSLQELLTIVETQV
jgi:hypothetical protein